MTDQPRIAEGAVLFEVTTKHKGVVRSRSVVLPLEHVSESEFMDVALAYWLALCRLRERA